MAKSAKSVATNAPGVVTVKVLAMTLDVTPARIHQLEREGILSKVARDAYQIFDCVPKYVKYLREENKRSTRQVAAQKVHDVRAREIEVRIAKEEQRLVDLEDVEAVYADAWGAFRSELDGLPAAFTRDMDQRGKLEGLLNGTFDRLRKRFDEARANGWSADDGSALETEETDT